MSVRAETHFSLNPTWLLGKVRPRAYEVYGALAAYVNYESGETFVGVKTIAELLGCSEDTVSNSIRELVEFGAVEVEERFTETGRRTTNLYTLRYTRESSGEVPREDAGDVSREDAGTLNETQRDETQRNELAPSGARARNPYWDWLVERFDLTAVTPQQRKRIGRLVREIIACLPVLEYDEAIEELDRRARTWPDHFPGATLTPEAYAKHFDALGRPPLRGDRRTSNREELLRAVEGIER